MIGGRTWTTYLDDGTQIDHGGAWFGPLQDRAYARAEEMGRTTYPTFYKGANILVRDGKVDRYEGPVPRIQPLKVVDVGRVILRMETMAKQLPLDAPWEARKARECDSITVGDWLNRNMVSNNARGMMSAVWSDAFGCDVSEVSLVSAPTNWAGSATMLGGAG
ncbi:Putative flavin-containing monoamine oxidase AofH [Mycobacterium simulans]|uniref:Flavin-containing monoamine oxidase AofH n=1 Tax=Mycobacterium simulans TaxID=627089 RepID=A0A7Z7ING2_9MYCO|nr:FAD-dependent oxidoreductase [Mycobacterium simulans]SOJ56843.1 Putative flavin-containing monoamine oxidase AofH [Mycobacterium simulans]